MRKRYITSHIKLSALILCTCSFAFAAKNNEKETNIVCYAAQSKWICAPEDKKELANIESTKLNEKDSANQLSSNVVIKQLKVPQFISSKGSQITNSQAKGIKPSIQTSNNDNLYENLWSYQLIGVSTPQNALNFVNKNGLNKNDILIIKSTHKNMDWWIVLYGLYKDKQTGIKDEVNIPSSVKKYWLRSLDNLIVNGYIDEF
jgi:septal ring-binding cell division protein DamX